jgi:hypothetical protein
MSSRNNGCSFNLQLSEFPKLETEAVGVHFDRGEFEKRGQIDH